MRVPPEYLLDLLAQRWHVAPWELEQAPDGTYVAAGLLFMRLEAEARSSHRGRQRER